MMISGRWKRIGKVTARLHIETRLFDTALYLEISTGNEPYFIDKNCSLKIKTSHGYKSASIRINLNAQSNRDAQILIMTYRRNNPHEYISFELTGLDGNIAQSIEVDGGELNYVPDHEEYMVKGCTCGVAVEHGSLTYELDPNCVVHGVLGKDCWKCGSEITKDVRRELGLDGVTYRNYHDNCESVKGPKRITPSKSSPDYRVTYSVLMDEEEIGFGSSFTDSDLKSCGEDISTAIQHGEWETVGGYPEPKDVLNAIEQRKYGVY